MSKVVENSLGTGPALRVASTYVQQQTWGERLKGASSSTGKASATVTSNSEYTAESQEHQSPLAALTDEVSQHSQQPADVYSDVSTAGEADLDQAPPVSNLTVPSPGAAFSALLPVGGESTLLADTITAMRTQLVGDASRLLAHQVDQFKNAFVAGSQILMAEADRIGAERLLARERELAKREASWAENLGFYLNHIGGLESRLKVLDGHFYKEFQMSFLDWEKGGFQSLRGMMGLPPRVEFPAAPTLSETAPVYPTPPFMRGAESTGAQFLGPEHAMPRARSPLIFRAVDFEAESPDEEGEAPIKID